jgi:hypothetical protein
MKLQEYIFFSIFDNVPYFQPPQWYTSDLSSAYLFSGSGKTTAAGRMELTKLRPTSGMRAADQVKPYIWPSQA